MPTTTNHQASSNSGTPGQQDVGLQIGLVHGREKVREIVDLVAQTRDYQQHPQNSRREGQRMRLSDQEVIESRVDGCSRRASRFTSKLSYFVSFRHERQRNTSTHLPAQSC